MNTLQPLLAFAETAKRGGFAAAARELGTAPSTLAKAVARLEAQLQLRLFHRTTRQVSLTADGERLYQRCQRVLDELEALQTEATGAQASPSGTLRIEMPITYGRNVMLPLLARLQQQHPGLSFDVRLSDAYADLVKDGIDVAIRVGTLPDSTLVARRFDAQQLVLVGAPAYLKRHGTPRTPAELKAHQVMAFRLPSRGRDRPLQFKPRGGKEFQLEPAGGHRFNDGDAMVRAAALGLGLGQVPSYMAAQELARGTLVELLRAYRPAPMPISAVTPGHRLVPARVRVLLEALAEYGRTQGAGIIRARGKSSTT